MTTALIRPLLAIIAVVATGLVLAACGSDNATGPSAAQITDAAGSATTATTSTTTAATTTTAPATTTTAPATTTTTAPATTTTTASADGKAVFTANCSGCHTLAAASASGQVGPNLDTLKPDDATVQRQVTNGGGGMPAFGGQLSDAEIKAVASFVSSSAGG
jgi:mono/diheme cytochrome c family protein